MSDILLTASVTGGIIILLWYFSYPLSKKYFTASWHYIMLKITILFLIFPVSIFAPDLNQSETSAISERIQIIKIKIDIDTEAINSVLSDIVFSDNINYTANIAENNNITAAYSDVPYLQIVWLAVSVIILSSGLHKMYKFKKQILYSSNSDIDSETLDLFLQCKKELKIHMRVSLRMSGYIRTPLAFGLINPVVILPEPDMNTDEKRLAFIHELTHIKNGDLWIKFFIFIVSSVHWFNPLVYLLRRKISVISEEYCDECVIRKMEKKERLLYGNLILKVASDVSMPEFCSTLSASTKNIKRRLFRMINLKKSRRGIIALSVVCALMMCSLATVYALSSNEDASNSNTLTESEAPPDAPADDYSDDSYIYLYSESDPEIRIRMPSYITFGPGYFSEDAEDMLYYASKARIPVTEDDVIIEDEWYWEDIGALTCEEYWTWVAEVLTSPSKYYVYDMPALFHVGDVRKSLWMLLHDVTSGLSFSGEGESVGQITFDRNGYFYNVFVVKE